MFSTCLHVVRSRVGDTLIGLLYTNVNKSVISTNKTCIPALDTSVYTEKPQESKNDFQKLNDGHKIVSKTNTKVCNNKT